MDEVDRNILNRIQSNFPIRPRPFKILGEELTTPEDEIMERVNRLIDAGYIRRLGASFDSRKLGFKSTLCAAKVPSEKINEFVGVLHGYKGITHNYRRVHEYNIWFTFIGKSKEDIQNTISEISHKTGIKDIINLPAKRIFKVNVEFET